MTVDENEAKDLIELANGRGMMKEVDWNTPIEKAEFIFKREFMMMEHNYLCACCKEKSAVQDTAKGILQPCWDCQKVWKLKRVTWIDRFFGDNK